MHESAPILVRMVAVAIGVGILAQVVAGRARLPSIVFLLAFGVLVGPDVLGWIEPDAFGIGLQAIVTVAVALILFEGGLELRLLDLAAVGGTIRNLVTIGAGITVVGAAAAAHYLAGFAWPLAFLFGAIVSVTGPTVITPLLDRVRVTRRIDTILRGEGILIDPVGAILTVVVLDIILSAETSLWSGFTEFAFRLLVGVAIGLVGGWSLGRVLRLKGVFADELKNLVVLAWVLVLFAAAEALASEAGLATVVIAGMAVRRESIPRENQLRRFKGELSVLFISMLFIMLSAHLPLATLAAVGWSGVWTVIVLMLVVRTVSVFVCTWGRDIRWRERLFLMWVSPRGVVAISIASFIALRMEVGSPQLVAAGLTGLDGEQLLALVFLTIAITVVVQGLTAGSVARVLGVEAEAGRYVIVVGANPLGRRVGTLLRDHAWDALLIDTNARNVRLARADGLVARVGSCLDRQVLEEAQMESATAVVAVTANQAVNFLVGQIALGEYRIPSVHPVLIDAEKGVGEVLVEDAGVDLAFGRPLDVADWNRSLDRDGVRQVVLSLGESPPEKPLGELDLPEGVLPVLTLRGERSYICHAGTRWNPDDRVVVLVTPKGEEGLGAAFGAAMEERLDPPAAAPAH
jgi:NhaP-type Na+/H+ or K+/H+ antiporter/Trk K+ transport system NAD-binding subunit